MDKDTQPAIFSFDILCVFQTSPGEMVKTKLVKYRVLTKRHVLILMASLFLAGALIVIIAAIIPYAYANVTASANKQMPICCTDRSNHTVSFTFDVDQGDTAPVLDTLQKYRVKATFFVTGEWAERYPEALKVLNTTGYEIGNGSDTYPHMPALSRNAMIKQINTCSDKIQSVTGARPALFRAPYGDYSNSLMEVLGSLNMKAIQWDVDSFDNKELTADALSERVTSQVCSGSIVRFHNDGKSTSEALPSIIEKLQSKGYEFLPVSAMIYSDNYTLNHEGRQIAKQ